eukprot:NODE_7245_length_453_cov_87.768844.p3 GENE.NODE_7245_length_453_cov_87.768844~~NODE_7245_length_453_cov_87.768844.p3  ORF type:complete len:95 (+),score=27.73 NODE_7245_length_453_cov_87.768844:3-287(+)
MGNDITKRWQHEWVFTDAGPHTLFGMVLAMLMLLWAPSKNSHRYAYSAQVGDDAEIPGPGRWAEEDEDEVAGKLQVGAGVAPDVIGRLWRLWHR